MSGQTPEEIEADIERQREQLANTVDALTEKLDVKSKAKNKVDSFKSSAQARANKAKDRTTSDDGKPDPNLVAGAASAVAVVSLVLYWRSRSY